MKSGELIYTYILSFYILLTYYSTNNVSKEKHNCTTTLHETGCFRERAQDPPPDHARRRLEAEEKQVDEAGELQRKADPFEADRHAFLFPADSDA